MKTKPNTLFTGLCLLLLASVLPAAEMTRLDARSGSKMRLEGTSDIHDWQAESSLILGSIEVGSNFPIDPGQNVPPGKVEARGEATITVRSLFSVTKEGKRYDDKMDAKMWEMLKGQTNPKITFKLNQLVLKEVPKDKSSPYLFDSKGDLTVAGATKPVSMAVKIMPQGEKNGDKRVKISGTVPLKMSDFGISPAVILFAKTADELTVKFDWVVGHKPVSAAK